jgi:hypothetical protein
MACLANPVSVSEDTGQPVPIGMAIEDMMITGEDMRDLKPEFPWRSGIPSEVDWDWANPVETLSRFFQQERSGTFLRQEVVRLVSERAAESVWNRMQHADITRGLRYDVVRLLPEDGRPVIHADKVLYRCEDYRGIKHDACIVRLQYGPIYTEIAATITDRGFSADEFYKAIEVADRKMILQRP